MSALAVAFDRSSPALVDCGSAAAGRSCRRLLAGPRQSGRLRGPLHRMAHRMTPHCCPRMRHQVEFVCADHPDLGACPDSLIRYSDQHREYGLRVHDGGSAVVEIAYCPWCGAELPASLRHRWFDELAALGIDDPLAQPIPEAFRSGAWWRWGRLKAAGRHPPMPVGGRVVSWPTRARPGRFPQVERSSSAARCLHRSGAPAWQREPQHLEHDRFI